MNTIESWERIEHFLQNVLYENIHQGTRFVYFYLFVWNVSSSKDLFWTKKNLFNKRFYDKFFLFNYLLIKDIKTIIINFFIEKLVLDFVVLI